MKNHLDSRTVDDAAYSGMTSMQTAARRLRDANIAVEPGELLRAAEKHRKRAANRYRRDPILVAQATRQRRLEEFKKLKRIRHAAMYRYWRADFRKRVQLEAQIDGNVDREAELATMESICRAAKKKKWTVSHTSSHGNRASSRYISITNVGKCRLSNHELPQTAEREYRYSVGQTPSWNGEVIIGNDWKTVGLTTWLRRILLAAAGR